MFTLYLAGPITGCNYEEATDWRKKFASILGHGNEIRCLSPMRGKEHLKNEVLLGSNYDHPLSRSKGIVTRDS